MIENEEMFVQMEDNMVKLLNYQRKFHTALNYDDEMALSWLSKRPTEVVGAEARKVAKLAEAAKHEAELADEILKREEFEKQ